MQHGWDRAHGGVYTCVDRDGSLMDTTKSVWFQGRFAFVCSFAYNNVERNQQWLMLPKAHWTLSRSIALMPMDTCISPSRLTAIRCASAVMYFQETFALLPCLNIPLPAAASRMPRRR